MKLGELKWFGEELEHVSGDLVWKDRHGNWTRTRGITLPVGKEFTRMDVVALNEGIVGGIPPDGTKFIFQLSQPRANPEIVMGA